MDQVLLLEQFKASYVANNIGNIRSRYAAPLQGICQTIQEHLFIVLDHLDKLFHVEQVTDAQIKKSSNEIYQSMFELRTLLNRTAFPSLGNHPLTIGRFESVYNDLFRFIDSVFRPNTILDPGGVPAKLARAFPDIQAFKERNIIDRDVMVRYEKNSDPNFYLQMLRNLDQEQVDALVNYATNIIYYNHFASLKKVKDDFSFPTEFSLRIEIPLGEGASEKKVSFFLLDKSSGSPVDLQCPYLNEPSSELLRSFVNKKIRPKLDPSQYEASEDKPLVVEINYQHKPMTKYERAEQVYCN